MPEFFTTRHSIKPKGEDLPSDQYEGISESGVELAQERTEDILKMIDQAEAGTVMVIGGASESARTGSTARVYGDRAKEIITETEREDLIVITAEDIEEENGYSNKVRKIRELVEANPDKKVIIDIPLFLSGFAMDRWMDEDGNFGPYTLDLLERHGKDMDGAVEEWIATGGKMGDLEGPDPQAVAEEHLESIEKLNSFVKKHIPDRPIIIGSVGHSWNLDALAVYLANDGQVNTEGWKKVGARQIGETEPIKLINGKLVYGDRELNLESE